MKLIVDKMPNRKQNCVFCEPHYDKMIFICKIDNKNCNLQEDSHIQYISCKWLKESKT